MSEEGFWLSVEAVIFARLSVDSLGWGAEEEDCCWWTSASAGEWLSAETADIIISSSRPMTAAAKAHRLGSDLEGPLKTIRAKWKKYITIINLISE